MKTWYNPPPVGNPHILGITGRINFSKINMLVGFACYLSSKQKAPEKPAFASKIAFFCRTLVQNSPIFNWGDPLS